MAIEEKLKLHADRGEIVPNRKLLKTPFQIEKIKESAAPVSYTHLDVYKRQE